jgi:nuclear transport factor 2 (NTF2) superfamily protein
MFVRDRPASRHDKAEMEQIMIYELRTYRCVPGRMAALLSRFQNETLRIWEKHGIRQAGFWTTLIGKSTQEITYMLVWDSMAGRERRWGAFLADPEWVALAYTPDSRWRNRVEFLQGRSEIEAFLTRKWRRELDYQLIKEFWAFRENRIAVRFAYEWRAANGHWFRSYGNENWEFDENGLMRVRIASINDLPIEESERKYHWPLGRRPDDHPSLSELGL